VVGTTWTGWSRKQGAQGRGGQSHPRYVHQPTCSATLMAVVGRLPAGTMTSGRRSSQTCIDWSILFRTHARSVARRAREVGLRLNWATLGENARCLVHLSREASERKHRKNRMVSVVVILSFCNIAN
jgi:hypothetical protein